MTDSEKRRALISPFSPSAASEIIVSRLKLRGAVGKQPYHMEMGCQARFIPSQDAIDRRFIIESWYMILLLQVGIDLLYFVILPPFQAMQLLKASDNDLELLIINQRLDRLSCTVSCCNRLADDRILTDRGHLKRPKQGSSSCEGV